MTNVAIMVIVQIAGAIERTRIERGKWRQVMIIFDLDGTLADCEHRRHFLIDPCDACFNCYQILKNAEKHPEQGVCGQCGRNPFIWKLDWPAFYEACDKDEPIAHVIALFTLVSTQYDAVEIWSGRSESVRNKTIDWIIDNFKAGIDERDYFNSILKMRPIGNTEPDDVLKERWLNQISASVNIISGGITQLKPVDFVFDSHPASIAMWRRRGIFVFNCCQEEGEF